MFHLNVYLFENSTEIVSNVRFGMFRLNSEKLDAKKCSDQKRPIVLQNPSSSRIDKIRMHLKTTTQNHTEKSINRVAFEWCDSFRFVEQNSALFSHISLWNAFDLCACVWQTLLRLDFSDCNFNYRVDIQFQCCWSALFSSKKKILEFLSNGLARIW